ncbi:trypsin inhibitor like cysteine rich domain-containing protein [Ditylenchus destructor]|nr:trypsin inhibitor like cysteine rich domain-containing protein [Ditylenchus destructor]
MGCKRGESAGVDRRGPAKRASLARLLSTYTAAWQAYLWSDTVYPHSPRLARHIENSEHIPTIESKEMRRSARLGEKQMNSKNEAETEPKAMKSQSDDRISNIATMDNGTMVESFKFLNYRQLAKNSLVSNRYWNLIRTHRHSLALLDIKEIRVPTRYTIMSFRSNHITLGTSHNLNRADTINGSGSIFFSEPEEDYKVLQALRDRTQLQFKLVSTRRHDIEDLTLECVQEIQTILRGFGFVQESYETHYDIFPQCWKFTLQPAANRTEAITICERDKPSKTNSLQTTVIFSEPQDDYEVLRALRDVPQYDLAFVNKGRHIFTYDSRIEFEMVLLGFGFVLESYVESCYKRIYYYELDTVYDEVVFVVVMLSVLLQVGEAILCPPNERFDHCGKRCEPSCRYPNPACPLSECTSEDFGCRCNEGLYRDGVRCVEETECMKK